MQIIFFLQIEAEREVNHHGQSKTVQVTPMEPDKDVINRQKLISRNEVEEVLARKQFYASLQERNARKLKICKFLGQKILPVFILSFAFIYFGLGISAMNK